MTGGKKEHWLSIPGEPSLEKSSASGGKVINRSCMPPPPPPPLPPCTSSVRSVNATPRHQSHTVRRGGEVGGSRDECERKEGEAEEEANRQNKERNKSANGREVAG